MHDIFRKFSSLILVSTATLSLADIPALPLESAFEMALNNSIEMQRAQQTMTNTQEALGVSVWDNTRIIASANTSNLLTDEAAEVVASIDFEVPVNSMLSVGSTLSSNEQFVLSASYQPFANEWVTPQMQLDAKKATINVTALAQSLRLNLDEASLDLSMAVWAEKLNATAFELAKLNVEKVNAFVFSGESSTTDMLQAQQAQSEALEAYVSAQIELNQAKQSWQLLAGVEPDKNAFVTPKDLADLIEQRDTALGTLEPLNVTSSSLETLEAELDYLNSELANLDDFESDLTFTAEYDVNAASAKAGVSINLSPSQFKADEITDSSLDLSLKQMEIDTEQANLSFERQRLQEKIAIQNAALSAAKSVYAELKISSEEAMYLGDLGERTELEVRQAALTAERAQYQVFASLVSVYLSQSDYEALFD